MQKYLEQSIEYEPERCSVLTVTAKYCFFSNSSSASRASLPRRKGNDNILYEVSDISTILTL